VDPILKYLVLPPLAAAEVEVITIMQQDLEDLEAGVVLPIQAAQAHQVRAIQAAQVVPITQPWAEAVVAVQT